jgi:hypothetical protein
MAIQRGPDPEQTSRMAVHLVQSLVTLFDRINVESTYCAMVYSTVTTHHSLLTFFSLDSIEFPPGLEHGIPPSIGIQHSQIMCRSNLLRRTRQSPQHPTSMGSAPTNMRQRKRLFKKRRGAWKQPLLHLIPLLQPRGIIHTIRAQRPLGLLQELVRKLRKKKLLASKQFKSNRCHKLGRIQKHPTTMSR